MAIGSGRGSSATCAVRAAIEPSARRRPVRVGLPWLAILGAATEESRSVGRDAFDVFIERRQHGLDGDRGDVVAAEFLRLDLD